MQYSVNYRRALFQLAFGGGLLFGVNPVASQALETQRFKNAPVIIGALLQGLDKVTARISTIEGPFDNLVKFGSLTIRVRACHKTPPTEAPESTAFLEIEEGFEQGSARPIFTGWMFASSPAVSALEHPVYDVWVVDCMKALSSNAESPG